YANRTDIPIYRGSYDVLLPSTFEDQNYHGVDGFADLTYDKEPDTSIIRSESAFVAMRDLIVNNPHEITMIVVGPMTNCAILLRMYEDVAENIKDIRIMGGNHHGVGNVVQAAEFNFHMDPEAAHIVLASAKCPMHLLTWECCNINAKTPMSWRLKELGTAAAGRTWQLIHRAESKIYSKPKEHWHPCDAYLVATLLYPEIIVDQSMEHVNVELAGRLTRGQVAIDHMHKRKPNVNLIKEINYKMFEKIIMAAHTQL
ncbi:nucleoside hydrolase-like, partial [Atheta coriaria]|uniref:nucleoside hydrolase-like n=1 Tax=Dalotia coriaria TaxID=877792 RepID=UPI0031F3A9F2